MKTILSLLFLVSLIPASVHAQQKKHRIVFDLVSKDTADHSAVLKQFANVLREDPDAELEVVCHGNAVFMLIQGASTVQEGIQALKKQGHVAFKICANSMRRYNLRKDQVIPEAEVVPVAILELADRESEGWSYIRAGH